MTIVLFWVLYFVSVVGIVLRINKSLNYWNVKFKKRNIEELLAEVSVIQILEKSSAEFEDILENNIKKFKESHFLFLVEKNREDIKSSIEKVTKKNEKLNYEIVEVEPDENRFVKLEKGLNKAKKFTIILDGNIEIEGNIDEIIEELVANDFIVNGLVYNAKENKMLAGFNGTFLNWHKLFSDLSLADSGKIAGINSEFYAARTKSLIEYGVFEKLKNKDYEDRELVKIALDNNMKILQSRVVGRIHNETNSFSKFVDSIGKEVEVMLDFLRDEINFTSYIIVAVPIIFPALTFLLSINLGLNYLLLVIVSLLIKSIDSYFMRRLMTEKSVGLAEIFREFLIDIFGIVFILFRKSR